MQRIIFASGNKGKVSEVRHILSDLNIKILSLNDIDFTGTIEEIGSTFEENAKLKAREIFHRYKIPAIADDSGLVVEQLNGKPGVHSARYAGNNTNDKLNNLKLLQELEKFPEPHSAKFVCAAVFYDGKNFHSANGEITGKIITSERGNNGFGYDPLFIPDGFNLTSAELSPEIKNSISHRYRAFSQLKKILAEFQYEY